MIDVKSWRAAKITQQKERWKTVSVADRVQRGPECQRGFTITEGSGFETGIMPSQADDCKTFLPRTFGEGCYRLARDATASHQWFMSIVKVQREVDFSKAQAMPESRTFPL